MLRRSNRFFQLWLFAPKHKSCKERHLRAVEVHLLQKCIIWQLNTASTPAWFPGTKKGPTGEGGPLVPDR